MSSILVLLPPLRKKNREPHSQQEKVGAKRVKIALEELFLPTPHHPSFSSFFTFSFAPFYIWVKESLHYLLPSFFWEKKLLPFFGKIKFLHWFCHPQSHGKNLTSPTNYLILSNVEKNVQNCSLEPQAEPCLSWHWALQRRFLLFSQRKHLQPGFLLPCMLALQLNRDRGVPGDTQRCFSCLWNWFLQTPPQCQESSELVLFWSSRSFLLTRQSETKQNNTKFTKTGNVILTPFPSP